MSAADPRGLAADRLAALFDLVAFHRTLNAQIHRTAEGIEVRARCDERFEGIPGRLHGGVVASLLDSASTWALIADTGEIFSTVDLRTDYLRPASVGELVVCGRVVACGANLARARAELVDASGRCCATASGAFVRVRPARPAA